MKFYINELWKEENLVDISTPAYLTINAKIRGPQTLNEITSKFEKINFIESYSINELSKNMTKIKIKYLGKIKNLQDSFAENGFDLNISHDEWVLNLQS